MLNPAILLAIVGVPALILYVVYVGLVLSGAAAVYLFILVTFLFPDYGTHYFGYGDIPAFFFVELAGGLSILLALLRRNRETEGAGVRALVGDARERVVCGILAATIAIHYLAYWPLRAAGYYPAGVPADAVVVHGLEMAVSLVFLYGCACFIRTFDQLEVVAWIFVFCAAELMVEQFVLMRLHLFSGVAQAAIDESGRFKSLTENDPLSVGVHGAIGLLCSIYLAVRRRNPFAALLVVPLWLMTYTTYQRTFLLAPAVASVFFVWQAGGRWMRRTLEIAIVCGAIIAAVLSTSLSDRFGSMYANTWRDHGPQSEGLNPLSTTQLEARVGLQARGADILAALFPFGPGEFVQRYLMASTAVPSQFPPPERLATAIDTYRDARSGLKVSELHNGYLEHVVAFGLLGMVGLMTFIGATLLNYRRAVAFSRGPVALVYAVLVFFGIYFVFYSYPKVYVGLFAFFHASFLISRPGEDDRAMRPSPA